MNIINNLNKNAYFSNVNRLFDISNYSTPLVATVSTLALGILALGVICCRTSCCKAKKRDIQPVNLPEPSDQIPFGQQKIKPPKQKSDVLSVARVETSSSEEIKTRQDVTKKINSGKFSEIDLTWTDSEKRNVLHIACMFCDNFEMLTSLVLYVLKEKPELMTQKSLKGELPLPLLGSNASIKSIPQSFALTINTQDSNGQTPFHLFCKQGNIQFILDSIIKFKCDLTITDKDEKTGFGLLEKSLKSLLIKKFQDVLNYIRSLNSSSHRKKKLPETPQDVINLYDAINATERKPKAFFKNILKELLNPEKARVRRAKSEKKAKGTCPAPVHFTLKKAGSILQLCRTFLEKQLFEISKRDFDDMEGLFRIAGNQQIKDGLIAKFLGGKPQEGELWDGASIFDAAKIMTRSLTQNLQSSLLNPNEYNSFDFKERDIEKIKLLIEKLPELKKNIFKNVLLFLNNLLKYEKKTKMDARNLGVIWGPALFRSNLLDNPKNPIESTETIGKINSFTEFLIKNANQLFTE